MNGRLAGSGRLVILPMDQGYEHGPARSFAPSPEAYDPHYLYELALEAGLSAYAAPLGPLEQGADAYAGQVPTILRLNSANSLAGGSRYDQAVTASVKDALRLGGVGIGFTMYPVPRPVRRMGSCATSSAKRARVRPRLGGLVLPAWRQDIERRRAASTSWPAPRTWRR